MRTLIAWAIIVGSALTVFGGPEPKEQQGLASWYGETHRGKLMANGKPFNPDKLTAASWFYPLGTRVRVTVSDRLMQRKSVLVTVTDRGPALDFVRKGRVIDLGQTAFKRIAPPDLGLIQVTVQAAN